MSWLKDGKKIGHSDAILRIESVKKEHKGMYQCFIRNDQESAEASAELKLGGRCKTIFVKQFFSLVNTLDVLFSRSTNYSSSFS